MAFILGGGEVEAERLGRRREEVMEEEEEDGERGGTRGCRGWGSGGNKASIRAWAAVRDEGGRGGSISAFWAWFVSFIGERRKKARGVGVLWWERTWKGVVGGGDERHPCGVDKLLVFEAGKV